MTAEEGNCALWGKSFAYKSWRGSGGPTVLALHGWLDNAASFDRLAPLVAGYRVVAVDLAGHGLTDHRSEDAAYNIWQDAGDMRAMMRALELDPVVVMGHSRGAMAATMLAATYPESVKALVLLDGVMPLPVTIGETVDQLRDAFDDRRKYQDRAPRYYATHEDALQSRLRGPLGLSRPAAELLAARGLGKNDSGFYWCGDPRLRGASEFKLTEAHSLEFVRRVRCPTLALLSLAQTAYNSRLVAANGGFQVVTMTGSHHLHLEAETHGEVAALVNAFLGRV